MKQFLRNLCITGAASRRCGLGWDARPQTATITSAIARICNTADRPSPQMHAVRWLCRGSLTLLWLGLAAGLSPATAQEILVGDIHPITGPAAFYGLPESRGIQLAAAQINAQGGVNVGGTSYKLRIVTEDDQASPTVGVAALRKLMAANVRYIVGPIASGVAPALTPIIARSSTTTQIVDGSIAGNITNGKNIFRNQATVDNYNLAVVELFKQYKFPSVAVMTDRFHAGFMGSQADLLSQLKALGVEVVGEEFHKLNEPLAKTQI